jgi:hypothetical protein
LTAASVPNPDGIATLRLSPIQAPAMTPEAFIAHWKNNATTERAGAAAFQ